MVSVPYAFKAAEADRLAGHSASEFVTTDSLQSAVQQQLQQQSDASTATGANGESTQPGTKSASKSAPTDPATNFVDSTSDQVVYVQQNITGVALECLGATKQRDCGHNQRDCPDGDYRRGGGRFFLGWQLWRLWGRHLQLVLESRSWHLGAIVQSQRHWVGGRRGGHGQHHWLDRGGDQHQWVCD